MKLNENKYWANTLFSEEIRVSREYFLHSGWFNVICLYFKWSVYKSPAVSNTFSIHFLLV